MNNLNSVTGIILAGGKSRRMGHDKAFLIIDGVPLVERVIKLFAAHFASVIIIGGEEKRFSSYNLPHYPDIYPGSAMGGLYTGLHHAGTPHIFVSACDLPYPSLEVMEHLLAQRSGFDAVVAESSIGLEPLFAVYAKSCLATLKQQLTEGNPCILDVYPKISTRVVTTGELQAIDSKTTTFCNLNTPQDLQQLITSKK